MSQESNTTQWFFTFNNPTHPQDGELLYYILSGCCKSFGFQYERGTTGTPHYQGEIQLLNKTRKPSKELRGPDGDLLLQEIHWERTRCPGAARKYCGKAEGRIDGPWRFGQNQGGGGGYKLALEAKSETEALSLIKCNHPRDWFNNGDRIRQNVVREFKQAPKAFVPRPVHTFKNVPSEIIDWYNENVARTVRDGPSDRYNMLVLEGKTKLGKTQYMRALGPHIYWKGMVKMDDLLRTDYTYIIIDDIEWEFIPNSIKKSVLLGTGDCIVTDKYVKKLAVCANRPCVYICNPPSSNWGNFYDSDDYWVNNTIVVKIKEKMF